MMVLELPQEVKGKTLVCKVDNQSLKAVIERKGSTRVIALNSIGKQIYWLQQWGEFALRLEYGKSCTYKRGPPPDGISQTSHPESERL